MKLSLRCIDWSRWTHLDVSVHLLSRANSGIEQIFFEICRVQNKSIMIYSQQANTVALHDIVSSLASVASTTYTCMIMAGTG